MKQLHINGTMILLLSCVLLTGCGKAGDGSDNQKEARTASQKTKKAQEELYSYETEMKDISGFEGRIKDAVMLGDTMYFIAGPDVYNVYDQKLYKLEHNKAAAEEVLLKDLGSNKCISVISVGNDGNLLAVASTMEAYPADYKDKWMVEHDKFFVKSNELWSIDADGEVLLKKELTSSAGVPGDRINYLTQDRQDNIYYSNSGLNVMNSSGQKILTFGDKHYWIADIFPTDAGNVIIAVVTDARDVNITMELYKVDLINKKISESFHTVKGVRAIRILEADDSHILYQAGDQCCNYRMDGEPPITLFTFSENFISFDDISSINKKDSGDFSLLTTKILTDSNGEEFPGSSQVVRMKRSDKPLNTDKTTVTILANANDSDLIGHIIDFNKSNSKYRIKTELFSEPDSDPETQEAEMAKKIMAGKGPDIIGFSVSGSNQLDLYTTKGFLEDLSPRMDKDLKKEDYLDNIINLCGRSGKIYGIIPNFYITSIAGKSSTLLNRKSWNTSDIMAFANEAGRGTRLLPEQITKKGILDLFVLSGSMDSFVDWENAACRFDSPGFMEQLAFANLCGSDEKVLENYNYKVEGDKIPGQLRSGEVLLNPAMIGQISSCKLYEKVFDAPITFIGYPAEEGSGNLVKPCMIWGINEKAQDKQKEGAWEFIKSYLSDEYQENIGPFRGFPVKKSALSKLYEEAMAPEYEEDENGNKVEKIKYTESINDVTMELTALTKEDIVQIDSLINGADKMEKYDVQIGNIIYEEAASYFAGQKTLKEAADIIQKRVSLYVNENS